MSVPTFEAYAEMLPRLEAEEALLAIQVQAAASGTLVRGAQQQFIRTLQQKARDRRQRVQAASLTALAEAGIGVKRA
jgi:hypothetical protein